MVNKLKSIFKVKEIRRRLLFSVGIFVVFRILVHVPLPNVDTQAVKSFFQSSQLLGLLDIFAGGGMQNFSVATLGIGPYINASIVMQLMTRVLPRLEELSKEGQSGWEQINTYTRYITIPLALFQAVAMYFLLRRQGIVENLSPFNLAVLAVTMATGTVLIMWLGELITEYGIGNGVSLIIFAGIVSRLPISFGQTFATATNQDVFNLVIVLAVFVFVIAGIIAVDEAERRVPVQYARRARGQGGLGGGESVLPLKINQAGVIPIFFAVSLMLIPGMVTNYLQEIPNEQIANIAGVINNLFSPNSFSYNIFYFLLVVGFTYFYTAVTFDPEKIADDIRRYGGFIPGVRPGRPTQRYLEYKITRITLAGAVFLGIIAIMPTIVQNLTGISTLTVGGTSILILVSVVLETMKKVESMMVMRDYDGFLN